MHVQKVRAVSPRCSGKNLRLRNIQALSLELVHAYCVSTGIQCFPCWRWCLRSVSWQLWRRARRQRPGRPLLAAAAAAAAAVAAELDWRPTTSARWIRSTKTFVSSPARYSTTPATCRRFRSSETTRCGKKLLQLKNRFRFHNITVCLLYSMKLGPTLPGTYTDS